MPRRMRTRIGKQRESRGAPGQFSQVDANGSPIQVGHAGVVHYWRKRFEKVSRLIPIDTFTIARNGQMERLLGARRSGAAWYLGAMTAEQGRTAHVSLDFLSEGRYRATSGKTAMRQMKPCVANVS